MNDGSFVKYFSQFHKRYRLFSARKAILEVAFFLTTIFASILTIDRIVSILSKNEPTLSKGIGILITLGVVLVITMLAGIFVFAKKSANAPLAKAIDDKLNSEELILTAVENSSSNTQSVFTNAIFEQASNTLSKASPQFLISTSIGYRWGILLALIAFVILFLLPARDLNGDRHYFSEMQNPKFPIPTTQQIPIAKMGTDTFPSNDKQSSDLNPKKKNGVGDKPGQLFGPESQRHKVKLLPEGVNPFVGKGSFVEKEKMLPTGEDDPNGAKSAYGDVFSQYQKVWEDAIHKESIPKTMREFVKSYFEEIKPK